MFSKKNPKALCIMTSMGYSGAPKMMAWLANNLSTKEYNVSVLTFYSDPDHQILNDKVKRIKLNVNRHKNKAAIVCALCKIFFLTLAQCIKIKPDIIIAFSNLPSGILLFFNKIFRYKIIVSERGDPYLETTFAMNWLRKQYNKACCVVFQTNNASHYFKDCKLRNIAVIPNPVTALPVKQCPLNLRSDYIAFVGRFNIRQKRHDLFLKSIQLVRNDYPNIKVEFFGEGEDFEKVKQMTKDYHLDDITTFAGQVDNIIEKISNAKLFVISSDFEGIPNSLIDAMLAGLPIVATDCSPGGAAMLIKNMQNGILVPRNDAEALSEGIKYLLSHPTEAQELGKQAQQVSTTFSPPKILSRWIDEIEHVLNH